MNKETKKIMMDEWRKINSEKCKQYSKKYRDSHKDELYRKRYEYESSINEGLLDGDNVNKRWTKEELRFVEQNMNSMKAEDIARTIGRSYFSVRTAEWRIRKGLVLND